MNKKLIHIIVLLLSSLGLTMSVQAQQLRTSSEIEDSMKARMLLLRDSLDYTDQKININTTNNEFAPMLLKGGLLYISNKPIPEAKVAFNKVYWSDITNVTTTKKTIIKDTASIIKLLKKPRNDDFTAATSNDNDILFWTKRLKIVTNSVEQKFGHFSTDQPFAFDDSTSMIVFVKKGNRRVQGKKRWELWQGYLSNGVVKQKRRLPFETRAADYIYPYITMDGQRLYFSSDVKGGQGGYDIYYVDKKQGEWSTIPQAVISINTKYDEIAASVVGDSILFSSNRPGGLGGFDVYVASSSKKQDAQNIGYPMNTTADEVGAKKLVDNYYVSTNRAGNFDVIGMNYHPIIFPVQGILTYKVDGSIAANQTIYVKDLELNTIVDSIRSGQNGDYVLKTRPNRQYALATFNCSVFL